MNKYESLKAIYELKNAFIAILSHQFNSIKIDSNLLINYNVEALIDLLINNDFPIYSGYMVEQLINFNENKLLLIQEIKEDKLCVNSLNKINDKVFFSIKSAVDFIEMLYLELKPKLAKELNQVFVDEKNLNVYHLQSLEEIKNFIKFILEKNPYAMLSAHSLALRITWASENFCELGLKEMSNLLDFQNGIYFKKGIDFEKLQEKNNNQMYEILKKQGIKPEAPYNLYDFLELDRKSGDNILKKLTQKGLVVRLSHNLFIEKQALEKLMQECLNLLKNQSLDVQSMKEYFNLSLVFSFEGLVFASLIFSLPFMVNPLQSAFSSINPNLLDASYSLGKSKIYTLFRVILPNSKAGIFSACAMSFAHTVGEFGVVMMIGGHKQGETLVASIAIYDELEILNYSLAHQYAFILFIFSFLVLFKFERLAIKASSSLFAISKALAICSKISRFLALKSASIKAIKTSTRKTLKRSFLGKGTSFKKSFAT